MFINSGIDNLWYSPRKAPVLFASVESQRHNDVRHTGLDVAMSHIRGRGTGHTD